MVFNLLNIYKILKSIIAQKKRPVKGLNFYQPMVGAVKATGVASTDARSKGKLCAFLSCITSKPRFARLRMSAQVLITRPSDDRSD